MVRHSLWLGCLLLAVVPAACAPAATSPSVTLPTADTEDPVVRITSPATGALVTSPVPVEALVEDNTGVSAVTVSARGGDGQVLLATQRVTPPSDEGDDNDDANSMPAVFVGTTTVSASLDVTGAGGVIFITVTAEDAFGNIGAQTIAIAVQEPAQSP